MESSEQIFFISEPKAFQPHYFTSRVHSNGDNYSLLVSFIDKQSIARSFKHVIRIPPKFILEISDMAGKSEGAHKVDLLLSEFVDLPAMFEGTKC